MNFKFLLFTIFCLSFSFSASAQLEKVMHQTFEIENASQISLDIMGDYSIEPWAGNNIMTETKVQLYDASPAILNHFIEKEMRYAVELKKTDNQVLLFSTDKERKTIRTKNGECFEEVKVRIFVPQDFELLNDNMLERKS